VSERDRARERGVMCACVRVMYACVHACLSVSMSPHTSTQASTAASTIRPAEGSDSSLGSQKRDPFSHLLKFPEEMEPLYDNLADEQQERRQLDAVRIQKNIMYIDRINDALDIDVKERIESDQLIEKLAISRLDNMQRKLVAQVRTRLCVPARASRWHRAVPCQV